MRRRFEKFEIVAESRSHVSGRDGKLGRFIGIRFVEIVAERVNERNRMVEKNDYVHKEKICEFETNDAMVEQ